MKIGNFLFTIIVAASLLTGSTLTVFGATMTVPSPREQMDMGISPANVVCNIGLKLIIRAESNTAACVKDISSDKLLQKGWAIKLSTLLEKNPNISSIGEVKTVQIVPLFKNEGIQQTQPNIVLNYNYVFEACAKSSLLRAPEVLVTSDSETKTVKLSEQIKPKTCQISSTIIKATDTKSITANLIKKTDLSLIVGQLEKRVVELQEKLVTEKKSLAELAKQTSTADYKKKIEEKTDKIINLRNDLNAARADLQKNNYALIVGFKEPTPLQVPIEKREITPPKPSLKEETAHVNIIKATPQFVDSGRLKSDPITSSYNFVFEACAGNQEILFPEILVRSDTEIKSVKLSEPIGIKSCQTSSTIIKAADSRSIQGVIITDGELSSQIKDLEVKIASLKEQLAIDKKSLADVAKQSPPPEDLKQRVSELTDKIINQRNELNDANQELTSLKYMVHE